MSMEKTVEEQLVQKAHTKIIVYDTSDNKYIKFAD